MQDTRSRQAMELFHEGQCIPAIPLVLTEDRQFDAEGQRKLVRYYLESGVGGIAIGVHTTQFAIRDPEHGLFEDVLQITVEEIDAYEAKHGKVVIKVAGAVGPTEQAVEEARLAKAMGFDLVLLSIGGLNDRSEAYLVERTAAVANEIPVIAFSMQVAVGGRIFSHDYWKQIAATEGVVGVKAAPFNRYETINIARAVALSERKDAITLYTGNDDNIIVDLLTPFRFRDADGEWQDIAIKGGLLGQWSAWTEGAVRLFEELKAIRSSGQQEIPLELLTRAAWLTEANAALFDPENDFAGCIPGVHQALVDDGQMAGIWTLDPLETLSPGQLDAIRRVQADYPVLLDEPGQTP